MASAPATTAGNEDPGGNTAASVGMSTLGGAASGAGIGTMFAPGIGTAIGAGAGAILGAVGSIYSGNAKAAAAEYNSKLEKIKSDQALAQAAEEARISSQRSQREIGQAEANAGASGVSMGGSALMAIQESASNAELNRRAILNKGEVEAYGYRNNIPLNTQAAQTGQTNGYLGAAGSLLSNAGGIASKLPIGTKDTAGNTEYGDYASEGYMVPEGAAP